MEQLVTAIVAVMAAAIAVLVGVAKHRGRQVQDAKAETAEANREIDHLRAERAAGRMTDAELDAKLGDVLARRLRASGPGNGHR